MDWLRFLLSLGIRKTWGLPSFYTVPKLKRPDVEWCHSPNFSTLKNRIITCVVIHATATSKVDSPKDWLTNPDSKVSAHYLIGLDGKIFQLVDEKNVAWHSGESTWNGWPNVNKFSIGIELVNANDGKQKYPPQQIMSCASLVAAICKDYTISPKNVIGHKDIAPGRKTDPAGFDFDDFRMTLADIKRKGEENA